MVDGSQVQDDDRLYGSALHVDLGDGELAGEVTPWPLRPGELHEQKFYLIDGRTIRRVAPLTEGYVGLSVAPDRKSILYTETGSGGRDLQLVDEFR